MKAQNYTNFKSNLAMMVMHLPVKFEFDWTKRFWVRVRKQKCCQTDKRPNRITPISKESGNKNVDGQKNGQMDRLNYNYTNFERNLAMMVIYVPVKFEFDWTNRFPVRVRKQKCWWTNRQTTKQTRLKICTKTIRPSWLIIFFNF